MAENLATHELIASDEYWGSTAELPSIPLGHTVIDGFSSAHLFAQSGAAKVQALFGQVLSHGFVSTPISQGEQLPLLERGEGLIKIVEDIRRLPIRDPNRRRLLPRIAQIDTPEDFDELAERMLTEPLYSDAVARTEVYHEPSERHARVWRVVSYLTGSKSGSQLEGISSSGLFRPPTEAAVNNLIPSIVVGESYKRNRPGTVASKVVEAQVLISGGSRRRAPKKALLPVRPRFAFNV